MLEDLNTVEAIAYPYTGRVVFECLPQILRRMALKEGGAQTNGR